MFFFFVSRCSFVLLHHSKIPFRILSARPLVLFFCITCWEVEVTIPIFPVRSVGASPLSGRNSKVKKYNQVRNSKQQSFISLQPRRKFPRTLARPTRGWFLGGECLRDREEGSTATCRRPQPNLCNLYHRFSLTFRRALPLAMRCQSMWNECKRRCRQKKSLLSC